MTTRLVTGGFLLAALIAFGAQLASCGGGDEDAKPTPDLSDPAAYLENAEKNALFFIRMDNYSFAPSMFDFNAGDVVALAIQNDAPEGHDFTIDVIRADVHVSYIDGLGFHTHTESDKPAELHFALTERGSGVVHIKVLEPGTYAFYCSLPDHREKGMEGTLVVH